MRSWEAVFSPLTFVTTGGFSEALIPGDCSLDSAAGMTAGTATPGMYSQGRTAVPPLAGAHTAIERTAARSIRMSSILLSALGPERWFSPKLHGAHVQWKSTGAN